MTAHFARAKCCALSFLLLFCVAPVSAQERPKGGYFDQDYVNSGFFDEPTPQAGTPVPANEPTNTPQVETVPESPSPVPTTAPLIATPEPIDLLRKGSAVIDQVKSMDSNPAVRERLMQTLQGVRSNVDRSLGVSGGTPAPEENVPNLSVATNVDDIAKELSLGEILKPAELTVYVSAKPRGTLKRVLEQALLASKRGAIVKAISIIGYSEDLSLYRKLEKEELLKLKQVLLEEGKSPDEQEKAWKKLEEATPPSAAILDHLKLARGEPKDSAKFLLLKEGVSLSPAWIVQTPKKRVVFQGNYAPAEFLDERGFLAREYPQETRGGTSFGDLEKLKETEAFVTLFEQKEEEVELGPETTRDLKACTRPRVRRLLVGPATLGSFFSPEFVVYAADDPDQEAQASSFTGAKIAYRSGKLMDEARNADPMIPYLVSLPIRCLPTRFRFVNVGPSQYMEFRQGEAAWQ